MKPTLLAAPDGAWDIALDGIIVGRIRPVPGGVTIAFGDISEREELLARFVFAGEPFAMMFRLVPAED